MMRFVLVYRPGRNWEPGRPWTEQSLYTHGAYMQELFDSGRLLYGGPFDDNAGGLAIVEAEDQGEAEKLLEADPAIIEGVKRASTRG